MKVSNELYQAGSQYLGSVAVLIYHLRTGKRSEGAEELIQEVQKWHGELEKIADVTENPLKEDPELSLTIRHVDKLIRVITEQHSFNTLAEGLEWFNQTNLLPCIIAHLESLGSTYNFRPQTASAS